MIKMERKTNLLRLAVVDIICVYLTYVMAISGNWLLVLLAILPWITFTYCTLIGLRYL